MPGINGRELHERLAADRPGLKVLYMSGYPGDVIAHHRVIDEETDFLEKPFSVKTLVRKVREVLDNGGSPLPDDRRRESDIPLAAEKI